MVSLLTVAFSGTKSVLQANFLPEIALDEDFDYSCALLDLFVKCKADPIEEINKKNINVFKKLTNFGEMHIACDIISDSYINNQRSHTIHQFNTTTSNVIGQTFVEIPKHLNYLTVKVKNLHSIQISIVDRNGKLVDFNGGEIICRINIKKDAN